jgi:Skp family chaperone for outer membrane proteins
VRTTQSGKGIRGLLALCFCAAPLFLSIAPAPALELSLEENKGESGTVGFVDIDRVFKGYSGTLLAREEFLSEIKKKEESVNQRKRVVYALKADIAKLRQERAFALTLPSLLATEAQLNRAEPRQQPPGDAPGASSAAAVAIFAAAGGSAETPVVSSATAGVITSTEAAPTAIAPAGVIISTTAADPLSPREEIPAVAQPPAGLPSGGVNMPGVTSVPVSFFKFSVSTAIPEIDNAIAAKETELKQKEDALKLYQRQVEKELLEYESHRSEMLLGRVYYALKELAVRSGVSVIVDKRSILFGHSAVDLTDKLLSALEAEQ